MRQLDLNDFFQEKGVWSLNTKNTILVVDDIEMNRAILGEIFKDEYEIIEAENGLKALEIIDQNKDKIASIFLDIIMPVMGGIEVMKEMNEKGLANKIPVFFITSDNSEDTMKQGYDLGVVDIIQKPINPYFIKRRIGNIIELYKARERLTDVVHSQAQEIIKKSEEIIELNYSFIETLSTAIEFRDCESGEHVRRMHDLTAFLLKNLKGYVKNADFDDDTIEEIATAAIMHDLGKITIPDAILNKPAKLTFDEFEIMKTHTVKGCEILERIPKYNVNTVFKYAYDICRHHHERWDGNGYPDKLKGEEIPIWAQVVAVADVYDALTAERVYKKAFDHETAINMILNGECGVFNPELLECVKSYEKEIEKNFCNYNK